MRAAVFCLLLAVVRGPRARGAPAYDSDSSVGSTYAEAREVSSESTGTSEPPALAAKPHAPPADGPSASGPFAALPAPEATSLQLFSRLTFDKDAQHRFVSLGKGSFGIVVAGSVVVDGVSVPVAVKYPNPEAKNLEGAVKTMGCERKALRKLWKPSPRLPPLRGIPGIFDVDPTGGPAIIGQAPTEFSLADAVVTDRLGDTVESLRKFFNFNEFEEREKMEERQPSEQERREWNKNTVPKRFDQLTASLVGLQILDTLEALHARHMVHGDVKPDNIACGLIKGGDYRAALSDPQLPLSHLYLLDFGLAKTHRIPASPGKRWGLFNPIRKFFPSKKEEQPRLNKVRGTAFYASHQVCRDYVDPWFRDDVESLLQTVMFLLNGGMPWRPKLDIDLLTQAKQHPEEFIQQYRKEGFRRATVPQQLVDMFVAIREQPWMDLPDYSIYRTGFMDMAKESWEAQQRDPLLGYDEVYFRNAYGFPMTPIPSDAEFPTGDYTDVREVLLPYFSWVRQTQHAADLARAREASLVEARNRPTPPSAQPSIYLLSVSTGKRLMHFIADAAHLA